MKKIISTIIILTMTLALIPLSASALVIDDWEIEISNNEAYIIGFNGTCPDKMTLPAKIGNFNVVGLKKDIFSENVSEIIIPEGYRSIAGNKYQDFPCFNVVADKLKRITLPSTLEKIGVSFENCTKLKEIHVPGKVKKIGDNFLANCSSLEKVELENGLESIGMYAFSDCVNLTDFIIPNTVITIGGGAFNNCDSLVNMVIPDSVRIFGTDDDGVGLWDRAVFTNCDNLETVVLSDNIEILCSSHIGGVGELSNCPKLKSVYIGNSVKKLQHSPDAFNGVMGGNESLETIIIPEGVVLISSGAFKNDYNLKNVVLPKSFSTISTGNEAYSKPFYKYDGWAPDQPLPKLFLYGYKGTYAESFANQKGFPFVDISVATPTNSKVKIDGTEVAFTAYNIGGNNYFKLRDVASAISGTSKNFNVDWDGTNNAISLISKTAYSNVGGELQINLNAVAVEPTITNPKIFVDGKLTTFMAFGINGNNYIKLRDLGEVFDFSVEWNDSTQTIEISTKKGYSK